MGPKKRGSGRGKKGTKKKKEKDKREIIRLAQLEKRFYLIKIKELDQQVGRLRVQSAELETQYDEAMLNIKKLDEDRADIIAYLKRTVQHKSDEIAELIERNYSLKTDSESKIKKLETDSVSLKEDNKQIEERLLAEIKLLNGKLISLEEFRSSRDELYNKFAVQEQAMAEQEENYKCLIYELQKQHLLNKNKLRQEMEDKLVNLSTDFQKTTQSRIASTTQNLIRENIAINNELFLLIASWEEIQDENEKLKIDLRDAKLNGTLTKDQLNQILTKNIIQKEVINKLTDEHSRIVNLANEHSQLKARISKLEQLNCHLEEEKNKAVRDFSRATQEKDMLLMRIDEQVVNFNKVQCHNSKLEKMIHRITIMVKEAIGLEEAREDGQEVDEADEYAKKQSLLSTLLELLNEEYLFISYAPEGEASTATNLSDTLFGYIGTLSQLKVTSSIMSHY